MVQEHKGAQDVMAARRLSPKMLAIILLILALVLLRGQLLFSYFWSNRGALTLNYQSRAGDGASPEAVFQAENLLQRALVYVPDNFFAQRMLGHLFVLTGQEVAAIEVWQEAGLAYEELVAWGKTAEIREQQQVAIAWYQRAALLSPQSSVPWYHMAQLYEQQEAWELALAAYQDAIERDQWADLPVLVGDAYARMALIYFSRLQPPDFERTLATAEAAIQQDAFQADWSIGHVHYLRGRVLWQTNRQEEAYEAFKTAVFAHDIDPNAHYWLGSAHYIVGHKVEDAIVALETSLALQPNNKWPYISLGQIYSEIGDPQQAQLAYEQALVIDPTDNIIQDRLAELGTKP